MILHNDTHDIEYSNAMRLQTREFTPEQWTDLKGMQLRSLPP